MSDSREALQRLLRITERQIAAIEARLVEPLTEESMRMALELAADLNEKRDELLVLLKGSWEEKT